MHRFFRLSTFAAAVCLPGISGAAGTAPIAIWPKGAPGAAAGAVEEHDTTKPGDNLVAGKCVIRLTDVSNPTITVYRPPKGKDTGAAVLVFPGGGYRILALDLEGTEVCEWLNSIGVTGVLLKYRVPPREGMPRYAAPLQDAQRALGIVRSRAPEWSLDPKRIGVLGFSAGGHLAAALSNQFDKRTYEPVDGADNVSCRPDFALVIYPGGLVPRDRPEKLSGEIAVTPAAPPTFLVQAEDDNVRVENSLLYFLALKNAKVPAEMHIYPTGGHGYGLRKSEAAVTTWPKRAEEWMLSQGVLHP